MNTPKFHVGQEIVALISDWLEPEEARLLGNPDVPKKGNQYTIASLRCELGSWGLDLEGLPALGFHEEYFAPVEELPAEALAELLEETLSPVTT